MLHKAKPRKKPPVPEMNVVSLMDILTTLIFFILMIATFTRYSIVPGAAMPSAAASTTEPKPVFSLLVEIQNAREATLRLGAIEKLKLVDSEATESYLRSNFSGSSSTGYVKRISAQGERDLLRKVQSALVEIKKGFPHEDKAVVSFSDAIPYQTVIDFVGGLRSLGPDQEAFTLKNLLGHADKSKVLFPLVLVSESGEN